MREDAKKFKENGTKKEPAKDFKDCEVLSSVSVMPLHISLGLQFLSMSKNITVSLDINVTADYLENL